MAVDTMSSPLYRRIYDDIKARIEDGTYGAGDKVPSEAELSSAYSVSRITVRRAIEDLSSDGYLIKRRGLGTFVCAPRMRRKLLQGGLAQSFTDACSKDGRVASARLISREIVTPRPDEIDFFKLGKDELVLHVRRLRLADGQPIFEENDFFPYAENKELATLDFTDRSVFQVMEELYGRKPERNARVTVEAISASADRASRLQMSSGDPLLRVTVYVQDQDGKPIYIGRQYNVGSRYMIEL